MFALAAPLTRAEWDKLQISISYYLSTKILTWIIRKNGSNDFIWHESLHAINKKCTTYGVEKTHITFPL